MGPPWDHSSRLRLVPGFKPSSSSDDGLHDNKEEVDSSFTALSMWGRISVGPDAPSEGLPSLDSFVPERPGRPPEMSAGEGDKAEGGTELTLHCAEGGFWLCPPSVEDR